MGSPCSAQRAELLEQGLLHLHPNKGSHWPGDRGVGEGTLQEAVIRSKVDKSPGSEGPGSWPSQEAVRVVLGLSLRWSVPQLGSCPSAQ